MPYMGMIEIFEPSLANAGFVGFLVNWVTCFVLFRVTTW